MSKKYNIRWQQTDSEQLKKAVSNFNRKIDRLSKKDPQNKNALPEKISVRQMRDLIDTRSDLKRELNSLRRFTQMGAETLVKVPTNDYNLNITKWQKQEMSRRTGIINRKRNKRLKEIQDIDMQSRGESLGYKRGQVGMGKTDEIALNPLKTFTPKMSQADINKKFKAIMKECQSSYWNKRELQMKDVFIRTLSENYNPEDVADIQLYLGQMDFKDFYAKFQSEGGNYEFAYPPDQEQYESYLEGLTSTWLPITKNEYIQSLEEHYKPDDIKKIESSIKKMDYNDFYELYKENKDKYMFRKKPYTKTYNKNLGALKKLWLS